MSHEKDAASSDLQENAIKVTKNTIFVWVGQPP
jgi:hypothetical protein